MGKAVALPGDPDLDARLDDAFGKPSITVGQLAVEAVAGPVLRETRNLAEALAMVQAAIPEVVKAEEGRVEKDGKTLYKYSYADLSAVTRAVLPMLGAVGLSWITMPTMVDGKFVLIYRLQHVSGDFLEGMYPLPANAKPQETGSAITYARRYALCSVTGVAPGDDDDAAEAQAAAKRSADSFRQGPVEMSRFERDAGLSFLALPTAEQRAAAGPQMMAAAFRQALEFRHCLDEHQAWEQPTGSVPATWITLFRERIRDEIEAADTGAEVNGVWETLKAERLLTDEVMAWLKARGAAIKERNAKAVDTITAQILAAETLEDLDPALESIVNALQMGRLTQEQHHTLMELHAERQGRLIRNQNEAAK